MKLINRLKNEICKEFLRIGARHYRYQNIILDIGDEFYIIEIYRAKHAKIAAEEIPKGKIIKPKFLTKVNQPEYWAAKKKQVNSPGYGDFLILDKSRGESKW